MTEAQALTRIKLLTNWEQYPPLTSEQTEYLLEQAKRIDEDLRYPSDANWEPTFNIPFAVSEGWELKAQNATDVFNFNDGGKSFEREQVIQHCKEQAKYWKSKSCGAVVLKSPNRPQALQTLNYGEGDIWL